MIIETSAIEWTGIVVAAITTVGAIVTGAIKFGGDYIIKKMDIIETEKRKNQFKENLNNLADDITNHSVIDAICQEIKDYVKATKCNVWMFHNGGYYYTGSPIQRISIVAGVSDESDNGMKSKFTNVPIGIFARNLEKLIDNDYTHEKNELSFSDTLGIINTQYNITSSALFKLTSLEYNYWIGMLSIGWLEHNELSEKEIEFVKSRIPVIVRLLSPKLLKSN